MQSKPAKPAWFDLTTRGGSPGRGDHQAGWHQLIGSLFAGMTILDVGAGMGQSRERLAGRSNAVTLQDPAPVPVDLHDPISQLPGASFDLVTCFDVIEHVAEDIEFLFHLERIAKRYVFLTTPNFNVSRAHNECHAREYDPPEFMALLRGSTTLLFAGDSSGLSRNILTPERFAHHTEPHQAALIIK